MDKKILPIGCDHGGYQLKLAVIEHLKAKGYEIQDQGCHSEESIDYPDYGHPVAAIVEENKGVLGIVICGSGNGAQMTANKHQGIRDGLVWNNEIVELIRLHNNANVLAIPARFVSLHQALGFVEIFLNTEFEGGRHQNRIDKIPTGCC